MTPSMDQDSTTVDSDKLNSVKHSRKRDVTCDKIVFCYSS